MWRSYLCVLPLVLAIVVGLLLPTVAVSRISLLQWSSDHETLVGPPTLSAYVDSLAFHRAGQVVKSLRAAFIAVGITAIVGLPTCVILSLTESAWLLRIAQTILIIPFFISSALRLHSLKVMLAHGGIGVHVGQLLGLPETLVRNLLFSDTGIVIGLCFSYSALLLLPLIYGLLQTPPTIFWAIRDSGYHLTQAVMLLLRLNLGAVLTGSLLFTFVSWFSALEYDILGSRRPVLAILQGLIAAKKLPECYALALLPTILTIGILFLLLCYGHPERVLKPDYSEANNA